jgi:hypothetical protein
MSWIVIRRITRRLGQRTSGTLVLLAVAVSAVVWLLSGHGAQPPNSALSSDKALAHSIPAQDVRLAMHADCHSHSLLVFSVMTAQKSVIIRHEQQQFVSISEMKAPRHPAFSSPAIGPGTGAGSSSASLRQVDPRQVAAEDAATDSLPASSGDRLGPEEDGIRPVQELVIEREQEREQELKQAQQEQQHEDQPHEHQNQQSLTQEPEQLQGEQVHEQQEQHAEQPIGMAQPAEDQIKAPSTVPITREFPTTPAISAVDSSQSQSTVIPSEPSPDKLNKTGQKVAPVQAGDSSSLSSWASTLSTSLIAPPAAPAKSEEKPAADKEEWTLLKAYYLARSIAKGLTSKQVVELAHILYKRKKSCSAPHLPPCNKELPSIPDFVPIHIFGPLSLVAANTASIFLSRGYDVHLRTTPLPVESPPAFEAMQSARLERLRAKYAVPLPLESDSELEVIGDLSAVAPRVGIYNVMTMGSSETSLSVEGTLEHVARIVRSVHILVVVVLSGEVHEVTRFESSLHSMLPAELASRVRIVRSPFVYGPYSVPEESPHVSMLASMLRLVMRVDSDIARMGASLKQLTAMFAAKVPCPTFAKAYGIPVFAGDVAQVIANVVHQRLHAWLFADAELAHVATETHESASGSSPTVSLEAIARQADRDTSGVATTKAVFPTWVAQSVEKPQLEGAGKCGHREAITAVMRVTRQQCCQALYPGSFFCPLRSTSPIESVRSQVVQDYVHRSAREVANYRLALRRQCTSVGAPFDVLTMCIATSQFVYHPEIVDCRTRMSEGLLRTAQWLLRVSTERAVGHSYHPALMRGDGVASRNDSLLRSVLPSISHLPVDFLQDASQLRRMCKSLPFLLAKTTVFPVKYLSLAPSPTPTQSVDSLATATHISEKQATIENTAAKTNEDEDTDESEESYEEPADPSTGDSSTAESSPAKGKQSKATDDDVPQENALAESQLAALRALHAPEDRIASALGVHSSLLPEMQVLHEWVVSFRPEPSVYRHCPVVVYTVLTGNRDDLYDVANDTAVWLVEHGVGATEGESAQQWCAFCFTDDPETQRKRTKLWRVVDIGQSPIANLRLASRVAKLVPHWVFPEATWTLYTDSKYELRKSPEFFLERFTSGFKRPWRVFEHDTRDYFAQELLQLSRQTRFRKVSIGDASRESLLLAAEDATLELSSGHQLVSAGIMLRDVQAASVRVMGEAWLLELVAHQPFERDQPTFLLAGGRLGVWSNGMGDLVHDMGWPVVDLVPITALEMERTCYWARHLRKGDIVCT